MLAFTEVRSGPVAFIPMLAIGWVGLVLQRKESYEAVDHQKRYIDFWLKFIGVKEVQTLVVEGTTWGGREKAELSITRGQETARKLAANF
jgi:FMN-dependent NADH-azoreductase